MKRLVVIAFSLVGSWTVACGSSSNGTSTANGAHSVTAFAAQYCKIIEPCCADAGLSTSGTQCLDQMSGGNEFQPYNPEAGQECLDAMLAASKKNDFCVDLAGNLPQCSYVFGGAVGGAGLSGAGEPCTSNADCAPAGGSSLCFMQTSGGNSTGICVQTQAGAVGQGPCVATVHGSLTSYQWSGRPPSTGYTCDVADGVWCNQATRECTALVATGTTCQADDECVTSDYCASGSCQPRVAAGGACGNTSGPECVRTAYCDFSSSICKPLLPNGTACTYPSMCQSSYCTSSGTCASFSMGNYNLATTCGK